MFRGRGAGDADPRWLGPQHFSVQANIHIIDDSWRKYRTDTVVQRPAKKYNVAGESLPLFKVLSQLDVRHLLKDLTVPTLVLHAREDAIIKFTEGQELAANIQGARFVRLESQNHLLLQSEPAWEVFISEVRAFLSSGPVVTRLHGTAPMRVQLAM